MAGVEVRLLLCGQRDLLFQGRQPGGKGFSEKVLVRIDPVALTGFQDPVDGGIRGTKALSIINISDTTRNAEIWY